MFSPAKLVVLLTAALSVAAVPSHMARNLHNHREIAARVALPQSEIAATAGQVSPGDVSDPVVRRVRRKRAGNGRCKPKTDVPTSIVEEDPKPTSTPHDEPTNTPKPDPEPTSTTPKPTPTPKPSPTPTPTPDSGNGGGQTYTGQGTFYATGLGACGIVNNDGQDIAAVSHLFFDSFPGYNGANPNNNPMCSKTAKVTYKGKTIYVKLTDRCEGCAYGDLDFSPHAFNQIADPSEGRINGISWQIVD